MQWIVAILIIILILPAGFVILTSIHTGDESYPNSLGGVWSTNLPTAFYAETNWQTGSMQDAGIEIRSVTLVIRGTGDPSVVDVTMSFTVTSSSINASSMYGDASSPDTYTGRINGDMLILDHGHGAVATFTITDTSLVGTWNESSGNDFYAQETFTEANGLKLYRQSVVVG